MSRYFLVKIFFCFIKHVRNKGMDNGACQYLQTKATVQDGANKARFSCENTHAFRAKNTRVPCEKQTHTVSIKFAYHVNTHFRANTLNVQRVVCGFREKLRKFLPHCPPYGYWTSDTARHLRLDRDRITRT